MHRVVLVCLGAGNGYLYVHHDHYKSLRSNAGLHLFQPEFELTEFQRGLLAFPPEEHAAQLLHLQLQMFDLQRLRDQFCLILFAQSRQDFGLPPS